MKQTIRSDAERRVRNEVLIALSSNPDFQVHESPDEIFVRVQLGRKRPTYLSVQVVQIFTQDSYRVLKEKYEALERAYNQTRKDKGC